jgi:multiple sugar transport system permease protein
MQTQTVKLPKLYLGMNARRSIREVFLYILLSLLGIVILFPFYYMFISSIRPPFFDFSGMIPDFFPKTASFLSYLKLFQGTVNYEPIPVVLLRATAVTIGVFIINTIATSFFNGIGAYVFAKRKFPAKQFLFTFLLITMVIPGQITLIPTYVMFHNWHWLDTLWVLTIPGWVGIGGIFFYRMFMVTIPDNLLEAARLDGANELQVVQHVIFPLTLPAFATSALFGFMGTWNSYIGPLLFCAGNPKIWMIQLVLGLIVGPGGFQYGYSYGDTTGLRMQTMFAGMVVTAIPTLLLFIIFQKQIIEGIRLTGVKTEE